MSQAQIVRPRQDSPEQLRSDEEPHLSIVGHFVAQEISQRGGGKQGQKGRLHDGGQVRPQDASDEIQDAGDQKKGAGNAPDGVFTHFVFNLRTAS